MGIINSKRRKHQNSYFNNNNNSNPYNGNNFITETNLSSYTSEEYFDFYEAINEMDFGYDTSSSSSSSTSIVDLNNNSNNNHLHHHHHNFNNIYNLNINYILSSSTGISGSNSGNRDNHINSSIYNNNIHNNNSLFNSGGKINHSFSNEWKCSSIFISYNLKITNNECTKQIVGDVKKRISTFKRSQMIEPLNSLLEFECQLNIGLDLLSTVLSKEIQNYILSFLSIYDLISLFQVNKYWYEISHDNSLWKRLVLRDCAKWGNRDIVKSTIYNDSNHITTVQSWRKYYIDMQVLKMCKHCDLLYRESSNSKNSCNYHSDIRDIVHSRGVPSGVYWVCCLSKPIKSLGCTTSSHEELIL